MPASNIEHPAPARHRVGLIALMFGIVGAPLGWTLQLLAGTALSGHQCYPRYFPLAVPLWTGTGWVLMTMTVLGLVLAVIAGVVSWRNWGRTRDEKPGPAHGGEGRTRFMALSGLLSSGLFIIAIVFTVAAIALVPLCSQ